MPVIETKGALSSQGFGEFTKVGGPPVYIEDVFQTWLYTGNSSSQAIANGLPLGTTASLVGKTITNLGGAFSGSYPLSNLNDGIAEIANAANIAFVPTANGYFDVYVDMGVSTVVTEYLIAPQGNRGDNPFNTPTAFTVKASNDASTWTTITSFTSISTTYPDWNPGSFRSFSFTNTTGYRYWRLENTTKGSSAAGVAISEWRLVVSTTAKSGLVWIKGRSAESDHILTDTTRGAGVSASNNNAISSNLTSAEDLGASYDYLSAFLTNGFAVTSGGTTTATRGTNYTGVTYVGWTFVEQAKFFDVVTYTGNGANRTIAHNLGSAPGCIIIKRTDTTAAWAVYHRSLANTEYLVLNTTAAKATDATYWNSTTPTATEFSLGTATDVNANTGTYVAYLFAHDAGGFGLTGTDNVISCGSFTASITGQSVTLGYEPQWLLLKKSDAGGDWRMLDIMRGFGVQGADNDALLQANNDFAENAPVNVAGPTATGFTHAADGSGATYIYIAIRRGPMKVPTDATKVFYPQAVAQAATVDSTNVPFPPDLVNTFSRNGTDRSNGFDLFQFVDRLRGIGTPNDTYSTSGLRLISSSTDGDGVNNGYVQLKANSQDITRGSGWNSANYGNWIYYFMRRAPSFFDIVCYTGNGVARAIKHNLGVAPQLMIIKGRSFAIGWGVYPNTNNFIRLDLANGYTGSSPTYWDDKTPTATEFYLGDSNFVNASTATYVAYLFATCTGVSKVGFYTGTGGAQTINCGFTTGARFVLIKRTAGIGYDWYVYDSARGITSGNDPYLWINSTAAEEAGTNYIDTDSTGFKITASAGAELNANGQNYLFLAIA